MNYQNIYRNYSWGIRKRVQKLYRRVETLVLEYDMTNACENLNLDEICASKSFFIRIGNESDDLEDIVRTFPDDLGFSTSATPEPVLRHEVAGRFRAGIPCFVARDKESGKLLGAVWTPKWSFPGLLPPEKRVLKANAITNLYAVPESQGLAIASYLLRYAIACERAVGNNYFFSLVTPELIPSLRTHLKEGFTIIWGGVIWNFLGKNIKIQRYGFRINPGSFPIVPVVIVTTIHHDGSTLLSTIRALGRCGIPVYVLAKSPLTYTGKTRFARNIELFNGNIADGELIRLLTETLDRMGIQKQKPVFVYTSENDIYRLHSMKQFLDEHFTVVPSGNVCNYLEKLNQLPLALEAGFKVPQSGVLKSRDKLTEIGKNFIFPIIVKPLARHTTGGFSAKALIFETQERFVESVSKCFDDMSTELLVQEYVPGDDTSVLFFMASCDAQGKVRACVSGRKLRQIPPGSGLMSSGIIEKNERMEAFSKKLCRLFQVSGFIGIEAKQHKETNELYYIETNFRPEAISALAEIAGTNLVLDTYLSAIGQPCFATPPRPTGSYMNLQYEIDALRQLVNDGKEKWSSFFRTLPRPTAYSLFAPDDPLPFLRWLVDAATLKVLRLLRLR